MDGSIHMVARKILQAPCNGWEEWFFEDPVSGRMRNINELRLELSNLLDQDRTKFVTNKS
jgi:hypothetical protein